MKIRQILLVSAFLGISTISCAPAEGELFLTTFIKNGELDKARAQAEDNMKLSNIKSEKEIKSYSGYLTIDEKSNSNLFFWFFPAQEAPDKAPIILWVNEVPGFSSIKGIFLETGPFRVDANNVVSERNTSWTKTHSMLYIDSPVGTGFSFSDTEDAFANNSEEDGGEIYEALKQFFTLFNEFQARDFYLAGEDYAASFIPNIVKRIETENAKGDFKINVKGFIIGSPYLDIQQSHKGQALYDFGLIDMEQKKIFDETADKAINMVQNGQVTEGTQLGLKTYIGPDSLLAQFTGFEDYFSALASKPTPEAEWFQKFIDSKEVHKYLHVGVHKYIGINFSVLNHFAKEISAYHGGVIEEMLNKGYRVLIYAPQFNIFLPQSSITEIVNKLKWNGADNYAKAPRKIWKANGEVAGYIKKADNFAYAIVRNAGNYAIQDQPEFMLDLVEKFIYNKEF